VLESTDKHIIVNYHYIEDPREDFAGIHPCPVEKFKKQIKFLSERFTIVSVPEVYTAAQKKSQEKFCALTFDDGLKDQYNNAVPILKEYGATATFFPITSTFEGRLPSTHKLYILLSHFSADELIDKCNIFFNEYHTKQAEKYQIPKDRRITTKRKLRDDIKTANIKEIMNILPNNIEAQCLSWLFKKLNLNEKDIVKEQFMSEKDIQKLNAEGFTIGSHTHNHYALDTQDNESIRNEIRLSKEHLERITPESLTIMSYPHGGTSKDVITILQDAGFTHAVTIEQSAVRITDSPYLLPRYDVNDIDM